MLSWPRTSRHPFRTSPQAVLTQQEYPRLGHHSSLNQPLLSLNGQRSPHKQMAPTAPPRHQHQSQSQQLQFSRLWVSRMRSWILTGSISWMKHPHCSLMQSSRLHPHTRATRIWLHLEPSDPRTRRRPRRAGISSSSQILALHQRVIVASHHRLAHLGVWVSLAVAA